MEPQDLRYHEEHEWIRVEGNKATLGISNFAQDALGDVVFIDLPKVGASLAAEAELGEVESTKATSTIYSPVTGSVVQVNQELEKIRPRTKSGPWAGSAVFDPATPGHHDSDSDEADREGPLSVDDSEGS